MKGQCSLVIAISIFKWNFSAREVPLNFEVDKLKKRTHYSFIVSVQISTEKCQFLGHSLLMQDSESYSNIESQSV